jgi:hypothetical protein
MQRKKCMVRNFFIGFGFFIFMFFPKRNQTLQGSLGEVFLLWWLPRGAECPPLPPPRKFLEGCIVFQEIVSSWFHFQRAYLT